MSLPPLFLVLLALPSLALSCDFPDPVCAHCVDIFPNTVDSCDGAILDHCDQQGYSASPCSTLQLACPFQHSYLSPCSVCTSDDKAACTQSVLTYCTYEIVQGNTNSLDHEIDPVCTAFVPSGCSAGEIKDCNGGCVAISKLNDNTCDENLNCVSLNYDGGDCGEVRPSPSGTPSSAPSPEACCTATSVECCSCLASQTQHQFCVDCRGGNSTSSNECCNACPATEQPVTLRTTFVFSGARLDDFTEEVLRGIRIGFAVVCSLNGLFDVAESDVTVVLFALPQKQAESVGADVSVELPSEQALVDATEAIANEQEVLYQVNTAIRTQNSSLLLTNLTKTTIQPAADDDDDDDNTPVIAAVVVVVLLVVVAIIVVAVCCYRRKSESPGSKVAGKSSGGGFPWDNKPNEASGNVML